MGLLGQLPYKRRVHKKIAPYESRTYVSRVHRPHKYVQRVFEQRTYKEREFWQRKYVPRWKKAEPEEKEKPVAAVEGESASGGSNQ